MQPAECVHFGVENLGKLTETRGLFQTDCIQRKRKLSPLQRYDI